MTGNLVVSTDTSPCFAAENISTGEKVELVSNATGDNGLHDVKKGKWMMRWRSDGSGDVHGGDKAFLFTDNEGGTLELRSPDTTLGMQADLFDNNEFRMYVFNIDPWELLSSFGYMKNRKKWFVDSCFDANGLSEHGVDLCDKYMQLGKHSKFIRLVIDDFLHDPNYNAGWNLFSLNEFEKSCRLCSFDISFYPVPGKKSVTFWIGAGNSTEWLRETYESDEYPYRKKFTISNDSSEKNMISVSGCMNIHQCSNFRFDMTPDFSYGGDPPFEICFMLSFIN